VWVFPHISAVANVAEVNEALRGYFLFIADGPVCGFFLVIIQQPAIAAGASGPSWSGGLLALVSE